MSEQQQTVISLPISYWEMHTGFWKISPELLKEAQGRQDKIIGRIKDGTLLKIGGESNKR